MTAAKKPRPRKGRTVVSKQLAACIAADLFTDGQGRKAARLRFDYSGSEGGTGWSIECMRDRIQKAISLPLRGDKKK